jgi:hypothetical protein
VCGLGDKIEDPLFLENLTSDINILLETWKDDPDKYELKSPINTIFPLLEKVETSPSSEIKSLS